MLQEMNESQPQQEVQPVKKFKIYADLYDNQTLEAAQKILTQA